MNPKDSLISDAMLMHQMESFALLEEYRIRAEEEEARKQEAAKSHEVNLSFDMVNNYPCGECIVYNRDRNADKALEIIKNISVEGMTALMGLNHLTAEDAGGEYLLTVKNHFYDNAAKCFNDNRTAAYYQNPKDYVGGKSLHSDLFKMDEGDALDILLSIYGEEEAETTIHPNRNIIAFSEKIMDLLWERVAQKTESTFLRNRIY